MEKDILLMEERGPALMPTLAEKRGVAASLAVGYLYMLVVTAEVPAWKGWLLGFAAALCLWGEAAFGRDGRRGEAWVWLGCLWTCLLGGLFGPNRVWGEDIWLLLHAFGAWWLLVRSGRLAGGACLPFDLFHGLLAVPFGKFLLRVKVAGACASDWRRGRKLNPWSALAGFAAAGVGLLLFCLAAVLLADADPNFRRFTADLENWLIRAKLDTFAVRLVFSLPVGAYLYAMIFGLIREGEKVPAARRARVEAGIASLRRVPGAVWQSMIGLFAAMYLAFFALQGSYLFDGLRGLLPEAFTAAEYARRGFFELCGVMAVNFTLLGAAWASAADGLRDSRAGKVLGAVLLVESMLLAVTAGAKLWLYIDRFGFTPLRLRGAWLVCVLFAGCGAALRGLLTGRDTTRAWLMFGGVTLALTCLA